MADVTVYSSNMCSACEMVKAFLNMRGVAFIEKNVSTDLEGRSELVSMGFDSTPVTVIAGRRIPGFDVRQFDSALAEVAGN